MVGGSLAGAVAMVALSVTAAYLLLRHRRTRRTSCKPGDFEALDAAGRAGGTGTSAVSSAISCAKLRRAAFKIKAKDIVIQHDERTDGPVLLGKGSFGEARASSCSPPSTPVQLRLHMRGL